MIAVSLFMYSEYKSLIRYNMQIFSSSPWVVLILT